MQVAQQALCATLNDLASDSLDPAPIVASGPLSSPLTKWCGAVMMMMMMMFDTHMTDLMSDTHIKRERERDDDVDVDRHSHETDMMLDMMIHSQASSVTQASTSLLINLFFDQVHHTGHEALV